MRASPKKIARWAAAATVLYFALGFGAIAAMFSPNLPDFTGTIFFCFASPALCLFEILTPLLRSLQLHDQGGFISFPTEGGIVLGVAICTTIIYWITFFVAESIANEQEETPPQTPTKMT